MSKLNFVNNLFLSPNKIETNFARHSFDLLLSLAFEHVNRVELFKQLLEDDTRQPNRMINVAGTEHHVPVFGIRVEAVMVDEYAAGLECIVNVGQKLVGVPAVLHNIYAQQRVELTKLLVAFQLLGAITQQANFFIK